MATSSRSVANDVRNVLDFLQESDLVRLTPVSGQVVVWSGGLLSRLVGLSGQVVLVL